MAEANTEEKREFITLVNKIVKVRDPANSIDNSGIIPFMYPDFIVKDELFFDYDNSVIIEAKYSPTLKSDLAHGTKRFIAICDSGMQDIDFTNKEIIIQVLKDRHKGRFSKDKIKVMLEMSESEFWREFKKHWVLNMSREIDDSKVSFYTLYKAIDGPSYKILNVYFQLREIYPDSTIFYSVLGFIDKAFHPESISTDNGEYIGLLNNVKDRAESIQKIVDYCYTMECSTDEDKEFRTIYLLKSLGSGRLV